MTDTLNPQAATPDSVAPSAPSDKTVLAWTHTARFLTTASQLVHLPPTELPVRVGDRGMATSPLRPSGKAEFGEEVIDVVADFGMIGEGTQVEVISADRFRIVVTRVDAPRG